MITIVLDYICIFLYANTRTHGELKSKIAIIFSGSTIIPCPRGENTCDQANNELAA